MGKKSQDGKLLQKQLEALKSRALEDPDNLSDIDEDNLEVEENSDYEAVNDEIDEELIKEQQERINENNKTKEEILRIKSKLETKFNSKFTAKELWLERLTVTPSSEMDKNLNLDDDIKRELYFYNLAHESAIKGILRLKDEKQKINRPDDFMAEMLKSDEQMMKVKKEILQHESRIKKFQLREEKMLNKKFIKKTKGKMSKETQEYKKTSTEAIDHWKRSIKQNPDEYYKLDEYVNKTVRSKKAMSRKARDRKFNPKLVHQEKMKENRKNFKKSGFNKQFRAPKGKKNRPGKNARSKGKGGFNKK